MKTLLILRHAKSSWKQPGLDDHDRPLNQRGKRDAPRMGQLLRIQSLLPDVILCSTAKRARKTAEKLIESSGFSGSCELHGDLYAAAPSDYIHSVSRLSDELQCAMVIGHNPGLEELLERLTGDYERLPTAALAQVELDIKSWRDVGKQSRGALVNVWRPRDLDF